MSRPAPYPTDTRAKGWRFELDYEQIEQSDTWDLAGEIPMAQHCLLMMWMVAWTQLPCGSLPNDEAVIKAKCKIPAATWSKCRAVLMRGWWLADDGRLYHDTLAQRVLEMMKRRRSDSDRKAQERMRKAAESGGNPGGVTTESRVTPTGLHPESSTDNRQPNTEEQKKKTSSATPTVPCPLDAIVGLYHETLPTLPRARLMPKARERALRHLWAWVLSSRKSDGTPRATNADEALAWIRDYFARAADNDFLMGRTTRTAEHANWRCDIDFLLSEKGMKHVIEKTEVAA